MSKYFKSFYCDNNRCYLGKKIKFDINKFNIKVITLLILFVSSSIGVFYLTQVNDIAVSGFRLDKLEKKYSLLQAENIKLQMKSIERQSLKNIEERSNELGMVKIDNFEYLSPATVVAVAK